MSFPLSISEQIKVLQSGADIATWSLKKLGLPDEWRDTNEPGNTERCQEAVDKLFTLSREDLVKGLAAQGLQPEDLSPFNTKPGSQDGHYFIAKKGEWHFYWQERGYPNFEARFDDLEEARKLLLNEFIPIWLERLRVSCRTKGGKKIKGI
ncbi:MAG: hypothetical protein ACO1TE_05500 [Prosthecobacter sp.]